MKFTKIIFVIVICIVGIVVYFYKLDSIPNGFYIDEALPGLSANSILHTGADEWGKAWPLVFRFYGSYNPPLFIYSVVLSIKLFGLSVFAVRFVSALCGFLTAVPMYLLVKDAKVFKTKHIAFIASFFFLLTPWLVLHSRVGYEVSMGLLLLSIGIYFLWRGRESAKYLVIAMLFLSLSTYAAYAERFIVPMLLTGFATVFRKSIFKKENRPFILQAFFVGLITQIPNLYLLTTPAFFPKSNLLATNFVFSQAAKSEGFLPASIAFVLSYAREVLSHFVVYFSPRSLFSLPDPDLQRSIPELSVFYSWMVVPYIVGFYLLYKNRKHNFAKYLSILLLVTPIPASITSDPFSTHRALPALVPLFLVIVWGIDEIISRIKGRIAFSVGLFVTGFSLFFLWRSYFVLLPHERAQYWGYGIDQIAQYAVTHPHEKIIIDQGRLKPIYAQLAFFMQYSPEEFQKSVPQDIKERYYNAVDFDSHFKFANVETRNINWESDPKGQFVLIGDSLSISTQQAKDHNLTQVLEIKDPMGEILFVGFKRNEK
jgi:4-amino-4-deoxy-L-arabinose transferase-like glycosyltransferase